MEWKRGVKINDIQEENLFKSFSSKTSKIINQKTLFKDKYIINSKLYKTKLSNINFKTSKISIINNIKFWIFNDINQS
jgi:hypothetical protein